MKARQLLGLLAIGAAPALTYTVPKFGFLGVFQAIGVGLSCAAAGAVVLWVGRAQPDKALRRAQYVTLGLSLLIAFGTWCGAR